MSLFTNRRPDGQPDAASSTDVWEGTEAWDDVDEMPAGAGGAAVGSVLDVPQAPKRRLDDHRAQAGNVEIDVTGLLEMLDVDDADDLTSISEAWQRFLADHQPLDSDDPDAAELKERIRREINTAYASFRLTRAD